MVVEAVVAGRDRSTARAVAMRYAAVAVVAVTLASVHLSRRPMTICPLRTLTGIPCPFCGGTTAAVNLGEGDLRGAIAASPLAVAMLSSWPLVGAVRMPAWWQSPRTRWIAITATLVAAEVWQLLRLHVVAF
jgi:hypothetical protein